MRFLQWRHRTSQAGWRPHHCTNGVEPPESAVGSNLSRSGKEQYPAVSSAWHRSSEPVGDCASARDPDGSGSRAAAHRMRESLRTPAGPRFHAQQGDRNSPGVGRGAKPYCTAASDRGRDSGRSGNCFRNSLPAVGLGLALQFSIRHSPAPIARERPMSSSSIRAWQPACGRRESRLARC